MNWQKLPNGILLKKGLIGSHLFVKFLMQILQS